MRPSWTAALPWRDGPPVPSTIRAPSITRSCMHVLHSRPWQSRRSPEPRDHLLGEQLERLETAIALEDPLAEQQEHLTERHVSQRVLDHAGDGVGVADQKRRAVLAEGRGPRVPHPEAV